MENNKYHNGKIYRIIGGNKTYYGSTVQRLCLRKAIHKHHYKIKFGSCKSFEIFDLVGDNFIMQLVENYKCNNRKELERREGFWIKNDPTAVNSYVSGRTKQEYYQDNRDEILRKAKDYYWNKKVKI